MKVLAIRQYAIITSILASQTIQATYQTGQSVVIVGYQIGDKSPDHINENEGSIETADDLMIIDDEVQEKTPPVYGKIFCFVRSLNVMKV